MSSILCLGCNKGLVKECKSDKYYIHVNHITGYHPHCLICKKCNKSLIKECKSNKHYIYVNQETGYHPKCLPCNYCGLGEVNGFYVFPDSRRHYYCKYKIKESEEID